MGSDYCCLYFHANACDIGQLHPTLQPICDELDLPIVAFEYPGYGLLSHYELSSRGVDLCAKLAFMYAVETLGYPPGNVLLFGRSIGTGPAAWLAATLWKHGITPAGLILQSPYTSLSAVAGELAPFAGEIARAVVEVSNHWNIEKCLRAVNNLPLLVIHGQKDETIPWTHGQTLASQCGSSSALKICHFPADADHSNFDFTADIVEPVRQLLYIAAAPRRRRVGQASLVRRHSSQNPIEPLYKKDSWKPPRTRRMAKRIRRQHFSSLPSSPVCTTKPSTNAPPSLASLVGPHLSKNRSVIRPRLQRLPGSLTASLSFPVERYSMGPGGQSSILEVFERLLIDENGLEEEEEEYEEGGGDGISVVAPSPPTSSPNTEAVGKGDSDQTLVPVDVSVPPAPLLLTWKFPLKRSISEGGDGLLNSTVKTVQTTNKIMGKSFYLLLQAMFGKESISPFSPPSPTMSPSSVSPISSKSCRAMEINDSPPVRVRARTMPPVQTLTKWRKPTREDLKSSSLSSTAVNEFPSVANQDTLSQQGGVDGLGAALLCRSDKTNNENDAEQDYELKREMHDYDDDNDKDDDLLPAILTVADHPEGDGKYEESRLRPPVVTKSTAEESLWATLHQQRRIKTTVNAMDSPPSPVVSTTSAAVRALSYISSLFPRPSHAPSVPTSPSSMASGLSFLASGPGPRCLKPVVQEEVLLRRGEGGNEQAEMCTSDVVTPTPASTFGTRRVVARSFVLPSKSDSTHYDESTAPLSPSSSHDAIPRTANENQDRGSSFLLSSTATRPSRRHTTTADS